MKKIYITVVLLLIIVQNGTTLNAAEVDVLRGVTDITDYSEFVSKNQDYEYLSELYNMYGENLRTSSEVIQKFKSGYLPESYFRNTIPVTTNYKVNLSSDGVLEETYVDIYSDGSISVRGFSTSNCSSGSGYSNCDIVWTTDNGSISTWAKSRYTMAQGSNNDQVTKVYPGAEATSHIEGVLAYAEDQYICRQSETSSKPASAEMEFITEGFPFPLMVNHARYQLDDETNGIYTHMLGDTGYYVSC